LDQELASHGMTLCEDGAALHVSGRLTGGDYVVPGNVSSQYISALLFALPMLPLNSTLRVTGILESAPYVAMTEEVLRKAGIRLEKEKQTYLIPGGQRFALPDRVTVEGDWSGAAFFLCMGALSDDGVRVEGLNLNSAQGDRAILTILRGFGAIVEEQSGAVHVRRGEVLHPCVIDASATPDLVPALSALAATVPGETRIENAARLRLKESDRLRTTAAMLTALGASVRELPDGLVIRGGGLHGGVVDAANDHRIAMAAAVAACAAAGDVTVLGAECIEKSYPAFWTDFAQLTML
ncbi:MAG: 3-phosphoshikimate 1-carboxyvinyltransferase, partial [Oscillospiraceae bacterium]|nr:3-phosphoshikimate 1-carboxyvinyltransferase [Oscillospiraceae bacterium]